MENLILVNEYLKIVTASFKKVILCMIFKRKLLIDFLDFNINVKKNLDKKKKKKENDKKEKKFSLKHQKKKSRK